LNIATQCAGMTAAMTAVVKNNGVIRVDFGTADKSRLARMSRSGSFLVVTARFSTSVWVGGGFQCAESCVSCRGLETLTRINTRKKYYVLMCNASHMFAGKQTEFTCGIWDLGSAKSGSSPQRTWLRKMSSIRPWRRRPKNCARAQDQVRAYFSHPHHVHHPLRMLHLHLANAQHLWSD
jgi:hypothetical protein